MHDTDILNDRVYLEKKELVIPETHGQKQETSVCTEFCVCLLGRAGLCGHLDYTSVLYLAQSKLNNAHMLGTLWTPPLLKYEILFSNREYKGASVSPLHS